MTQPPPAATGSLSIAITGLPGGVNASVTVTGPSGFTRSVTANETLTNLAPGTYTLAAANVTVPDGRYAPAQSSQNVTVAAGAGAASATVAYSLATGSLTITVSGLPAGTTAAITVTGPNGFTRAVTGTTTIAVLDPGTYTVGAASVSTTDDTFAAAAPNQAVTVTAGATPVAASVAYALASGRLTISVSGLPASMGPLGAVNAAIVVTGPGGFQQQVLATSTLTRLTPGVYTISAADVTSSSYRYAPTPATQTATVAASTTPVSVNFLYSAVDAALRVEISGLPPGATANVSVTGPGGFSRSVGATTTLPSLQVGSYTVSATPVLFGQTTYTLSPPATQNVNLAAGMTGTVVVAYTAPVTLRLQQIVSGLSRPVHMVSPPSDTRLFVVEQTGRIRIVQNQQLLSQPFLDLSAKVLPVLNFGDEHGLLGLAFHPQYATNGYFFVFYMDPARNIVIERYQVSSNPDVASTTGTVVLTVPHPSSTDHNGGGLVFGTDGYLYVSIGDGGCCYDPLGAAQNLNTLLGKVLRIDVSALPYTVPASNPFVGQAGRRPEIWAYGLRNPWRIDIDPANGTLYIADVGEDDREEVNAAAGTAGVNYGWPLAEGTSCLSAGCTGPALQPPLVEYSHAEGCSITGGFVYRGLQIPEIQGFYFYSDWCAGFLRSFRFANGVANDQRLWPIPAPGFVTSFGRDGAGELYMLTQAGALHKIVRQ